MKLSKDLTPILWRLWRLILLFVGWRLVLWMCHYDIGQLILTGLWVSLIWAGCIFWFQRARQQKQPLWPVVAITIIMGCGQGAALIFLLVDFVKHHF